MQIFKMLSRQVLLKTNSGAQLIDSSSNFQPTAVKHPSKYPSVCAKIPSANHIPKENFISANDGLLSPKKRFHHVEL